MQPKESRWVCRVPFLLGLSLLGFALAAVMPMVWPQYYRNFIIKTIKMGPGTHTFKMWKDNPVPVYIEFFFFNWTNREAMATEGEMHIPQFQELGPYRFTERIDRVNVTWNSNNTITYQQARWWHFDPEHSKGSLDDNITTLNVVALTAANTVQDWGFVMKASLSAGLSATGQQVHVIKPVRQLLFEGYSDKLIDLARSMPSLSGVKVPFDKFAWFYMRNGTTFMDGVFNMNTGHEDIRRTGKLENWNYRNRTDYFSGECGDVVGTTGQLFPPGQTRENKVQMFSPDLCRSVAFDYSQDTVVEGVHGYKYTGGISMLDNGTVYPEAECFCNGDCVPSGVTNLTSCRFGAPAFASYPHFYLADPFFTDSVRGMRPNKEKHEFYLTLEPTTGIPLDVAARFQINLLLQPFPSISLYQKVPALFFPMLWFQQRATLPTSLSYSLRLLLFMEHLGLCLAVLGVIAGCSICAYTVILWAKSHKNRLKKDVDDSHLYVAALESTQNHKNSSKQYIIMKPKNKMNVSSKL